MPESISILPTAGIFYTAAARSGWQHDSPTTPATALLDWAASNSIITQEAADRAQIPVYDPGTPRIIKRIGRTKSNLEAIVTIYGQGSFNYSLKFIVVKTLNRLQPLNIKPEELGISSDDLADAWPSKPRKIDMLLGQDILFSLESDRPRVQIPNQPHLFGRHTRLGVIIYGEYMHSTMTRTDCVAPDAVSSSLNQSDSEEAGVHSPSHKSCFVSLPPDPAKHGWHQDGLPEVDYGGAMRQDGRRVGQTLT